MTDKGGGFLAWYSGCAVEIWWRFQACQSQKGLWIKRALKKKNSGAPSFSFSPTPLAAAQGETAFSSSDLSG